MSPSAAAAATAMRRRRSRSSVTDEAPDRAELLSVLEAAGTVADHGALRPWRVIEIRGDQRQRVGAALAEAAGAEGRDAEKLVGKAMRAPLMLAVVVSPVPSHKVPRWEQETVAAGVAHALTLLLDEAGWGVMWRTGPYARSAAVHRAHGLAPDEELLGWLYVGGLRAKDAEKGPKRKPFPAERHLSRLA